MDGTEKMSKEKARLYLSEMFTRLLVKVECAAETLNENQLSAAARIARNAQIFAFEASRFVIEQKELSFLPQINHVLAVLEKSAAMQDDRSLKALLLLDSAVAIVDAQAFLADGTGRMEHALSCKRIAEFCLNQSTASR